MKSKEAAVIVASKFGKVEASLRYLAENNETLSCVDVNTVSYRGLFAAEGT